MSCMLRRSVLLVCCWLGCVASACGQNGPGGIVINARGVVEARSELARPEVLSRAKFRAAALAAQPGELGQKTPLRMVSLPALETAARELRVAGKPLPDEIRFLAGLQRIDFVVLLPETHDVVIAGPAEAFAPNELGVMVGATSLRPVLRLDDLLTIVRSRADSIGCSIDPVQSRLADVNRYLQTVGDAASVSAALKRYDTLAERLGMQDVRVWGVDPTSGAARVLVEADYRMKRISVGHEKSRVRGLPSYLETKQAGTNSMRRWWFAPFYESLERSEDGAVWKLNGQRVQLLSQDELVNDDGERRDNGTPQASSHEYARMFTAKYPALASRATVFAELQNLFDLAVAVAIIRNQNMSQQAGWELNEFMDAMALPTQRFPVATQVPSIANSRRAGRYAVVGVVGGGVRLHPESVLRSVHTITVPRIRSRDGVVSRPAGRQQWWWDTPRTEH